MRLKGLGIRIIGAGDGYDSEAPRMGLDHALRARMSEMILSDHRTRVHRALADRFNRGYHIGGIPYGYASQPAPRGQGRHLLIDPAKAAIVTRIFTGLAAGQAAPDIVHALNNEGEPGPRGMAWAVSALVGNSKRGTAVLNSELYVGRRTWNRRVWQKDPVTGTRRGVDRPRSEWLQHESPHLRILSTHLWESARRCAGLGETL